MAYQVSTTIASNQQLIDAICTFAAANGWTIDRNNLVAANRTATLHKDGVTDYVHLFNTNTSEVRLRASVGYSSGALPSAQPNVSATDAVSNNLTGPFPSVWFFANGDELDVVVRRSDTTGAYSHITFGRIQKYGAFDGGTFVDGAYFETTGTNSGRWDGGNDHGTWGYGSNAAGYVRADSTEDSLTNQWRTLGNNNNQPASPYAFSHVGPLGSANSYTDNQGYPTRTIGRLINAADDNTFSGRSVLQPIEVIVSRIGTPTYLSPIGYVANRRYVSLAKFDPEQEVTIAGETWVMFPVVRKGTESSTNNAPNASANNGFALRKVA